MKMKTPEMSVVRFDEEDILTASGDTTRWSLGSWRASSAQTVVKDNGAFKARTNSQWTDDPIADGNYNYLDGIGYSEDYGRIFTSGEFYHFDLDSITKEEDFYWNWKTCTDESHRYLVDPGK